MASRYATLAEMFHLIDTNGDGFLDLAELDLVFDGEGSDIIEQFDTDGSGRLTEAEFCNGLLEDVDDMDDQLKWISTAINEAGIQPRPPKLADSEAIERARAADLEHRDYLAQLAAKLKAAASSGEQLTFEQFLQLVERVTAEASSTQREDAAIMLFAMADSDENLKVSTDDFNWSFSRAQPNGPPPAPTSQAAKTTDRQAMPVSSTRNRSSSDSSPDTDEFLREQDDSLRELRLILSKEDYEELIGRHDSDDYEYYNE